MPALFALLAAGIGAGVLLVVSGLRGTPRRPAARTDPRRRPVRRVRAAGVLAAAALVGVATGWPAAAVLAAAAGWVLPAVLGPDRAHHRALARLEAIAAWAEDLTGTLRAAAGIEQTIIATAAHAPAAIRTQVTALARALQAGGRLPVALRAFADELADPTADLVVNVLIQAAQHQARDIATGLAGVGAAARRQASARLRIAAGRARTRTSARIVIAVVLASTVGLVVFAHDFLTPYAHPLGQLILTVLGAMVAGCLAWMIRIARIPDLPRILTKPDGSAIDPTQEPTIGLVSS